MLIFGAFWSGEIESPYTLSDQMRVLESLAGKPIGGAMPIGHTPLSLPLTLPFALLGRESLGAASIAWTLISLVCLWSVLRPLFAEAGIGGITLGRAAVCLALISEAALNAVELGQTSILAAAALLILAAEQPWRTWQRLLALMTLLLKLPYLICGLGVLIVMRRWRDLASLAIISAVLATVISLRIGVEGWRAYLASLAVYTGDVPAHYAGSIVFETMTTFRSAFRGAIGDGAARGIASVVYGVASVTLIACGAFANDLRFKRLAIVLLIGIYLCFSPYAGRYEDMLALVPLAMLTTGAGRRFREGGIALLTVVALNTGVFAQLGLGTAVLWCLKLGLFAALALQSIRGENSAAGAPSGRET